MSGLSLWRQSPGSLLDSWDNWARDMDRLLSNNGRNEQNQFRQLPCDVSETTDSFLLEFDMPGIEADNIDIEVESGSLIVRAKRELKEETDDGNVHRIERHYGEFRRAFTLPENVRTDQIEADYTNGVLTIGIPKADLPKPKKVKVGTKSKGLSGKLGSTENDKAKAANES